MTMVQSSAKLLVRALRGERTERPPIWLMRQAGRYLPEYNRTREAAGGMLALCRSPEHATEVTLQPIHRFHFDGAILFADLPQIAHAMGQNLHYAQGAGPVLDPVIRSADDIARHLDVSAFHQHIAPVYATVERLAAALPADVALIGYAGAPWTVATYMVEGHGGAATDFAHVKNWAFRDPDGFQRLIDLLVSVTSEYLNRQIEAGAEIVQLFESYAGVLPEPFFQRWCEAPVAAIVRAVKAKHPAVPIIAFPRGAGLLIAPYAAATDADAIGLDSTVPLGWAADTLQRDLRRCVQGNLDPQMLIVGGARMAEEVDRILAALSPGPFVFNLGHGITPQTPPDHVAALVQQVKAWRRAA